MAHDLKDYKELHIGIAVRLLPGVFVSADNECTTNAGQGMLPFCYVFCLFFVQLKFGSILRRLVILG